MKKIDLEVQEALQKIHLQQNSSTSSRTWSPTVGEKVWVYRWRRPSKFSTYWTGPHLVQKQLSTKVWRVDIGEGKVSDVHLDQLKPYYAEVVGRSWPLHYVKAERPDDYAEINMWDVEEVLAHRKGGAEGVEFLTHWSGFSKEDTTLFPQLQASSSASTGTGPSTARSKTSKWMF